MPKTDITIETSSGIKNLTLYTRNGKVTLADVNIGKADLTAASVPVITDKDKLINSPITVAGNEYNATCVSVGNPHCVVFCDSVDAVDLATVGPQFENAPIFPERVNTEFVRVVNPTFGSAEAARPSPAARALVRLLLRRSKTDTARKAKT